MLNNLKALPVDPIFEVLYKFRADSNPDKINLSIGVYADEDGSPFVFPTVQKAARRLQVDNFGYLSMKGDDTFLGHVERLFLGDEIAGKKLFAAQQATGGTHACRLISDLIKRDFGSTNVLVGVPTWGNYFQIFGDHKIVKFDHLDDERGVNYEEYERNILAANEGDVLILQGGDTHNPTGKNLQISDLEKLVPIIKEKKVFVFVDYAYFGFGGGFDEDRKFLTFLAENLDDFAFGVSFSKNASFYRHRLGALFVKSRDDKHRDTVESNLQNLVRGAISNNPSFGSEIMNDIFENHFEEWENEVDAVRESMNKRRDLLVDKLPEKFKHLGSCAGMFGITGLSREQVIELQDKKSLYMPYDGRVNFGGIKLSEIDVIAGIFSSIKN